MNVLIEERYMQDIADAIREKNGTEDTYKPSQMADAVRGIESGGEIFKTPYGVMYTSIYDTGECREIGAVGAPSNILRYADKLVEATIRWTKAQGGHNADMVSESSIQRLYMPILKTTNTYVARKCLYLEIAILGSIGNSVTMLSGYTFNGCTQDFLTITIYVDAETLADISTDITTNAPWGATNATIIYRNSTTGEVITA